MRYITYTIRIYRSVRFSTLYHIHSEKTIHTLFAGQINHSTFKNYPKNFSQVLDKRIANLHSSYNATKSEIKELDMVMKNVDMILGKGKEKDRQRYVQRKRSGELEL